MKVRIRWFLCTIAIAALGGPIELRGQATITGTLRQLTTHAANQFDPAISGDLVVYVDERNGNDDVYFMNVVTGAETRVTSSTTPQRLHDVSGGRIVYTDLTPPAARIRLYDVATGVDTVITPGFDQDARIDGQICVFERGSSSATDIYAVDLATNTETAVATSAALEANPSVSGSRIVYERRAAADAPGEIVLFDLATHVETVLAGSGANNRRPDIDGTIVVWDTEAADGSLDVVICDASTGQPRTLALPGNQRFAHVSGRFVSFDDDALGNPDVVLYDRQTGAMARVGASPAADFLNDISGHRLVFTSTASGNQDIWAYEFQVIGDTLFSVAPAGGNNNSVLSTIAPAAAEIAAVGPLDPDPNVYAQATGLTSRPADRQLFAWNNWKYDSSGQIVYTGELVTVDACTGLGARVNPAAAPQGNLASVAFAPDGTLFATSDIFGLHRIDPATGEQTVVGSFDAGLRIKAIAFVPDGTLYAAELTCGVAGLGCPIPRLFTIDTHSGAATLVGSFSVDPGRVDSLVFDSSTRNFLGGSDQGRGGLLFDLNPADATVSNVRPLVASPTPGVLAPSQSGMAFAPSCSIAVAPTSIQFGSVEVSASKSQIVTATNDGAVPVTVNGVSLDAGGSAGFVLGVVSVPAQLAVGGSLDIPVSFAPSTAGGASSVLHIATSARTIDLAMRGTGVAKPLPPSEQIAQIQQFVADAVAAGRLAGSGQGNSANGRLDALRNMLQAASDLIQQGAIAQACRQLLDVLNRTDGNPQPPDFVSGPAAADLAAKVKALRSSLGCP